ncbi:hypothetical protein KJ966_21500 [bacterium]|nr:hypothetical protein [bacterium]
MRTPQHQPQPPFSISSLFTSNPAFKDRDGDGFFDDLNLRIQVHPQVTDPQIWASLLNLTARIGFEFVTLETDFVAISDVTNTKLNQIIVLPTGKNPPGYSSSIEPGFLWKLSETVVYIGGSEETKIAEQISQLATGCNQTKNSLLETLPPKSDNSRESAYFDLFHLNRSPILYGSSADDPRGVRFNGSFLLEGDEISPELGLILANILNHFLLDATETTLPLVYSGNAHGETAICFSILEIPNKPGHVQVESLDDTEQIKVKLCGDSKDLVRFLERWTSITLYRPGRECEAAETLRDALNRSMEIMEGSGFWGHWAHLLADQVLTCNHVLPAVQSNHYQMIQKAVNCLELDVQLVREEHDTIIRNETWESESEVLLKRIESIPEGSGPISGEIFISKPLKTRQILKEKITDLLKIKGYLPDFEIYNAYKPGLSWLLETVLPSLEQIQGLDKILVSCRPFPVDNGTLESGSRWLQELYPGVDILKERLNIDEQKIQVEWDNPIDSTYNIKGLNANQEIVYTATLDPHIYRLPYLPGTETRQWVHPCTGYVSLKTPLVELVDDRIPTDRELFWNILQTEWIPVLESTMKTRLKNENTGGQTAFWEILEIEVNVEETEMSLNIDSERISSMEALQEDIYFVLLDFCVDFTARHNLPSSIQLGQIFPKVSFKEKTSQPTATLKATPLSWLNFPTSTPKTDTDSIAIEAVALEKECWKIQFKAGNKETEKATAQILPKIAQSWGLDLQFKNSRFHLTIPEPDNSNPRCEQESLKPSLPVDQPLTILETTKKLTYLNQQPGLRSYVIANSWQGRPIRVMEGTAIESDKPYSTARLRMVKPTILFNSRHHANEVSATTATLNLADDLITTEMGKQWRKNFNILLIPMENMDGTAMLENLLPDCPDYMLHAARFNAVGAEFSGDYFKKNPSFPEALAKTRMWQTWLPELVVDQHGVPDHEWNLPFSGYLPKRFEQFWIPRTFAYVILPYLTTPDHPHYAFAQIAVESLNMAMKEEEDIQALNRKLEKRYNLYARNPQPEIFPPSDGQPLLAVPNLPRLNNTNAAILFPKITKSEIVVEVPDEVVTGQRFELCVKANRIIQKTLINLQPKVRGRLNAEMDANQTSCRLSWLSYLDTKSIGFEAE